MTPENDVSLRGQLGEALDGRRADVANPEVLLADRPVDAALEALIDVGGDGRVARPGAHVVAGAVRPQRRDDTGRRLLVQRERAVVRRARHQRAADAGPSQGALTVDSQLAGAKSLTLLGTGVAPALLATDTGGADEGVVDFGRVTSGSTRQQTITLLNRGDQALPPPTIEVTGAEPAAFAFESSCAEPLAFEQTCEVTLTFAPTVARTVWRNVANPANSAVTS